MAAAPAIPSEDFYPLVHSVATSLDSLRLNLSLAVHQHRPESVEVLHSLHSHLSEVAHSLPPPSTTSFQRFYNSKLVHSAPESIDCVPLLVAPQPLPATEIAAPESLGSVKGALKSMISSVYASSYVEKLNKVQLGYWVFLLHQKFSSSKVATTASTTFYAWLQQNEIVPSGLPMDHLRNAELLFNLVATYPRLLFCHHASSDDLLKYRSEIFQHFADNPEEAAKFRALPIDQQSVQLHIQKESLQYTDSGSAHLLAPLLRPIEPELVKKVSNVLRLEDLAIQTHFAAWAQDPASLSNDPLSPRLDLITETSVNPAAKTNNVPAPTGVHVQLINYVTATQPPPTTKPQAVGGVPNQGCSGFAVPPSVVQEILPKLKASLAIFKSSHSPALLFPEDALKKESSRAAAAIVTGVGVPDAVSSFLENFDSAIPSDSPVLARWKLLPASVQGALVLRTLHAIVAALESPPALPSRLVGLAGQLELWKIDKKGLGTLAEALVKSLAATPTSISSTVLESLSGVINQIISSLAPSMEGADVQLLQGKSWKTMWATFGSSTLELHSNISSVPKKVDLKKVGKVTQWTKTAYAKVEPPTPYCLVLVPTSDGGEDDSGDSEDSAESASALTRFICFHSEDDLNTWGESVLLRVEALALRSMFGVTSARKTSSKQVSDKAKRAPSGISLPKRTPEKTTSSLKLTTVVTPTGTPSSNTPVATPRSAAATAATKDIPAESSDSESSSASTSTPSGAGAAATSSPATKAAKAQNRLSQALPSRPSASRIITAGKVVEDVLLDDTMYVGFRRFLSERQASENLLFFKAAHNYKQAKKKGLKGNAARQRAEDVYDKYLSASSDSQVTVAAKTLETIEALLFGDNDPPGDIFMAAASEVSHLVLEALFHQFLPTFKGSPDAPGAK